MEIIFGESVTNVFIIKMSVYYHLNKSKLYAINPIDTNDIHVNL